MKHAGLLFYTLVLLACLGVLYVWDLSYAEEIPLLYDSKLLIGYYVFRGTFYVEDMKLLEQPPNRYFLTEMYRARPPDSSSGLVFRFPLWTLVVLLLAYATCVLIIPAYRRRRRFRSGRCIQCGYNLTGNVSSVCPECGCATFTRNGTSPTTNGQEPADAVRYLRQLSRSCGIILRSPRHVGFVVLMLAVTFFGYRSCNRDGVRGTQIWLDPDAPLPAYDVYITWDNYDGWNVDEEVKFVWCGEVIGQGHKGLDQLFDRLYALPAGSRVLVHPQVFVDGMSSEPQSFALPWHVYPSERLNEMLEMNLVYMYLPRDHGGVMHPDCESYWGQSAFSR